ncbi:MAG TPA: hypothetical protein VFD85_05885 [Gemmatimonadales bacterium]|nr:hypothetical protein [Gemmatimonadales bacterium]
MNSLATWINAVADFCFAAVFLITWIAPNTFGEHTLRFLMLVMMMEFVVVHSSAFMGNVMISRANRGAQATALAGFGLFYSLFAGAFALAFKTWWPITMFWGQTLNRMLGVLFGQVPDDDQKAFIQRSWIASVLLYLVSAFVTIVMPMPRLGITSAVIAAQQIHSSGLWVEQPQRVLAFGVMYFLLTGWSDLRGHTWASGIKVARS